MNAAAHEFGLMGRRRSSLAERTRALIAAVFEVKTRRAYKAVFLDEQGELTGAGALVLADMAKAAGVGKALHGPGVTAGELAEREGRRAELLHVLARLDGANLKRAAKRLTALQTTMRENDDE